MHLEGQANQSSILRFYEMFSRRKFEALTVSVKFGSVGGTNQSPKMAEAEKLSRPEGYLPRRTKGCGQCAGCKRPNCDACRFCMDNPRNGGKNKLKQRCLHRVCTNFSVVSRPFYRRLLGDQISALALPSHSLFSPRRCTEHRRA